MNAQERTTLHRILENLVTHHDQDSRRCPGPGNCPLAAAIEDLGYVLSNAVANAGKVDSGFDDPTNPEAFKICPKCKSTDISDLGPDQILFPRFKCLACGTLMDEIPEASYGPEMRVEDLPLAATEPQASPETLAAISEARDATPTVIGTERPEPDSDTAHAILRAQGRLP